MMSEAEQALAMTARPLNTAERPAMPISTIRPRYCGFNYRHFADVTLKNIEKRAASDFAEFGDNAWMAKATRLTCDVRELLNEVREQRLILDAMNEELVATRLYAEQLRRDRPTKVPEVLASIAHDLTEHPPPCPIPSCVYFLLLDETLVYVGQSFGLHGRLSTHLSNKQFNRVFYMPVPAEHLDAVELDLIRRFRPPLNRAGLEMGVSRGT